VLVFLSFGLAALSRLLVRRVDHISVSATVMVATAEAEESRQDDRPAGED